MLMTSYQTEVGLKNHPKVGVGTVVLKNDQVLLGKRKNAHGAGTWSICGGHLEFGESVETCALRELFEETGLVALTYQLGPWSNDIMSFDKHYLSVFVFVTKFQGELQNREPHKCEGWHWFSWDSLPTPLFTTVSSLVRITGIDTLKSISRST